MNFKFLIFSFSIFTLSAQQKDLFKEPQQKEAEPIEKAHSAVEQKPNLDLVGLMKTAKETLAAVKMNNKVIFVQKGSIITDSSNSTWIVKSIDDSQLILESLSSKKLIVYR